MPISCDNKILSSRFDYAPSGVDGTVMTRAASTTSVTAVRTTTAPTTTASECGYFDATSRCWFLVATPASHPRLWREYLDGARENYRHHGVESVVEYDDIVDGLSTTLFFVALDDVGRVVGGVRVQGPYMCADQAHAVQEWTDHPGIAQVYAMIDGRIPSGVIELKTAWCGAQAERRGELTSALSRIAPHALSLLGVRFAFATAAGYVLDRWATCGGVMEDSIPGVPYPDERYLTRMMWWDKHTYVDKTHHTQLPALLAEAAQLEGARVPSDSFAEDGLGDGVGRE